MIWILAWLILDRGIQLFNSFLSVASRNLKTHAITHSLQREREETVYKKPDTHSYGIDKISKLKCDKFSLTEVEQASTENNKA